MVAGVTMGGLPVFSKRSVRAMLISARALPGSEMKTVRMSSSTAVIFAPAFSRFFLQLERIALNGEVEVADGEAADDVADGAAREVKIHARGAGYVLHQADALELVRGQPDFHRVNVVSHSFRSGCRAFNSKAMQAAIAPGGGPDLPKLSTRFPQLKPLHSPVLCHPDASGLNQSTYAQWNLCGKLKKITQRLHFGYCQGGFRSLSTKRCENQAAGL